MYAAAAKAGFALAPNTATASNSDSNQCGEDSWTDDDLLEILNQFPDEEFNVEMMMDMDFDSNNITDDSSVSMNDDASTHSSMTGSSQVVPTMPVLPKFDFGANFGLQSPESGFVALPCANAFSHLTYKSPEMIREEKLSALDPFIGALNEGDLFSLFSLCQSQCAPDVTFSSKSCNFAYGGSLAVVTFWTLLFEKHYQARLQCLSRRVNSALQPAMIRHNNQLMGKLCDNSVFETVDFVLKLEGSRLSEFNGFDVFQKLMQSGYLNDNLSLPELIHLIEGFYCQHAQQQQQLMQQHRIFNMVYLFEVHLTFHALHHTITHWDFELLGVESH